MNDYEIIDVHAHLTWNSYDSDRDDVIERMKSGSIGAITIGVDYDSSVQAIELAKQKDNLWATVGIHPDHSPADEEFDKIIELAEDKIVVGIGECGLDYFRDDVSRDEQEKIFRQHINLAAKTGKPIMIHTRDQRGCFGVYDDAYRILCEHSEKVHPHFHFYAGDISMTEKLLDLGATFSITAVITLTNDYDEMIRKIPIENLMIETDSPFVAPKRIRGKRNEPSFINDVLGRIAEIKGMTTNEMKFALRENTYKVFGI